MNAFNWQQEVEHTLVQLVSFKYVQLGSWTYLKLTIGSLNSFWHLGKMLCVYDMY